ncbi:hypothetical protein BE20_27015 [Sorangium cellulosum]|uniref:Periplasmic binding protein domain-containing protein n=1 Tax=Sorangium cellulosum TaxID=56 RepID=A0A150SGP1_SORCE|nr:hypothetical protein BE20_27015 [Sorangium cellulosum]KYF91606.1 hypothetical protein BE18_38830 [Sorangium cellulosum]
MKPQQNLWKLACAALAVLSMAWSAGCDQGGGGAVSGDGNGKSSPDTAKVVKLAFVTSGSSEFWKIAIAGVKKYEQEAKIQVDVKMPQNSTVDNAAQRLKGIQDAVTLVDTGVDVIDKQNVAEFKARLVALKR